ncbi:MAG: saccharopine dehydrogenase NADP-binding domain-containing protein [Gemmatimonadales bacterium]|nr:saccharopine dehydrogenase NADP-binding domain-containing protein [Gemmatimonadales bacterium]
MKVIILGAGLVGGPMALDLAADPRFEVSVADINAGALDNLAARAKITPLVQDLSMSDDVTRLVGNFDFVVSAVPGFMGFRTLEAVIAAGVNVVDIAFFPEDPFLLDDLALEKGVVAIMDCGVFPGMGSALIGRAARRLDKVTNILTYVGGLPEVRQWPWEYKAVFSPVDVIEEYIRPARYVENGVLVTRPALSDPELIDFPEVGTLEAFNTDGLRTLLRTIDAPNMKEKTLRFPGHIQKMALLRDSGFFSEDPIDVNGVMIKPLDVTAKLLFPMWELRQGEGEFTVLQINIEGNLDGRKVRYRYDLLDRFDHDTGTTSMARTTGFTATVAVRMVADGLYGETGISPPEYLGRQPGCVPYLLEGLAGRGVIYSEVLEELD